MHVYVHEEEEKRRLLSGAEWPASLNWATISVQKHTASPKNTHNDKIGFTCEPWAHLYSGERVKKAIIATTHRLKSGANICFFCLNLFDTIECDKNFDTFTCKLKLTLWCA